MAKESTMQLRMDSDMKEQVESLYRSTSFAEAIRMFAAQSLRVNGLPFQLTAESPAKDNSVADLAGSLKQYAKPEN